MNNLTKTKVGGGKTFKRFLALFLLVAGCATGAWAQDTEVAKLDLTSAGSHSSYGDSWSVGDWTLYGGANNNGGWAYVRFGGGKSAQSGTATITSPQISDAVNSVEISHNGVSNNALTVSEISLETSADQKFNTIISSVSADESDIAAIAVGTSNTITINFGEQIAAGNYYRVNIKWSNTSSSKNYGFDVYSVVLKKAASTDPAINATDAVTYAADITSGEIAYTISNPDGSTLSAATKASWISILAVADGKVTFDMEENEETTAREGVITLTYGELTKNVTVTQQGAKEKYTVTLADDASTLTEAVGGEGVTLPTRADVTPYTFMGWAAAELTDETTTEPTVFSGAYNPESNITLYPVYVRTEGSGAKETTVSTTIADYASANNWTNSTKYNSITLNDNITATAAGGGNTGKYYTSDNSWRLYSSESATLSISANGGATLKSVALTYPAQKGTMSYNDPNIESGVAVPVTGTEAIFNVASGQGQITAISVTYTVNSGTSYYTSHPATATITLSEACTDGTKYYGTFSYGKSAFIVPEDLTVSRVIVDANGKLLVDDYNTGDVVGKNTGVMVSSATAGEHTVVLTTKTSETKQNMLLSSGSDGVTAGGMETAASGYKFYRLTMHRGTQLGFFWGAENGAAFDIAANKAYLAVPEANAANMQGFIFGDTETAIKGINANKGGKQAIYNLQGQRVSRAVKGIYIVNGKKVIIK